MIYELKKWNNPNEKLVQMAKWETDKGLPDVGNLKLLARLLSTSLDRLLDDAEEADEEQNAELKTQAEALTPEVLNAMTVKELRSVARDLNITNMTRKEIRFGKKEDLVTSICKFLEQK